MWSNIFLLVFIILFFAALLVFRKEISNLLFSLSNICGRAKILQFGSMNMILGDDDTPFLKQQQEYSSIKQAEFSKAFQSPIITVEEKIIKEQLLSAGFTSEQAISILIYQLANKNLINKLLTINNLIFKEQVELLIFLNSQFKPQPENLLYRYYQVWFENNKESDYKFHGFLNYLIKEKLISQCFEGYSIGEIGKEYLIFLVKIGRPFPSGS